MDKIVGKVKKQIEKAKIKRILQKTNRDSKFKRT